MPTEFWGSPTSLVQRAISPPSRILLTNYPFWQHIISDRRANGPYYLSPSITTSSGRGIDHRSYYCKYLSLGIFFMAILKWRYSTIWIYTVYRLLETVESAPIVKTERYRPLRVKKGAFQGARARTYYGKVEKISDEIFFTHNLET